MVVIPAYQNAGTIGDVVKRAKMFCDAVMVVSDGSTDSTAEVAREVGARVVVHGSNLGKGEAIKHAISLAHDENFTHVVTLDGDGQHYPEDLPDILSRARSAPQALILGERDLLAANLPRRNRVGNAWSNFWVNLAMGTHFSDTQCGFRVYPVALMGAFRLHGSGYEFETEVLIRAKREGISVLSVPVRVYYPPMHLRVSHFVPWRDATRIVLTVIRFLILPRRWW